MGELHLEIYAERMKREYGVPCVTGKPQVAFRETIIDTSKFHYTHKKQTGGAGQFARVIGFIQPFERNPETGKDVEFESVVMSGNVPSGYIPAVEKVSTLQMTNLCVDRAARASLKRWKKVRLAGTLCMASDTSSRTVPLMQLIRPNLLSSSPPSARFARHTRTPNPSFSSLS